MAGESRDDQKIGQILLEDQIVSSLDLAQALEEQKKLEKKTSRRFKLGEVLLFMQKITLPQLHQALQKQRQKADSSRRFAQMAQKKQIEDQETTEKMRESFAQFKNLNAKASEEESSFLTKLSGLFKAK